jgi:hypothetical protein
MTNILLGIAIAVALVGGVLVAFVRRSAPRSAGSVDLRNVTVSRQWLMEHQSHD